MIAMPTAGIYTLPQQLPGIYVAASGEKAAETAAKIGDGLVSTAPNADLVKTFEQAGGQGKPKYAEMTVCWASDEESATKTALEIWPNAGLSGELSQELPLPRHFEQAAETVRAEDLSSLPLGPDPQKHKEALKKYVEAGFTHVAIHQIGPDQDGFFRFYERELASRLQQRGAANGRKERVPAGARGGSA